MSLGIAIFSMVSVVALSSAATVATLAATGQLESAQIEKEQLIISEQRVEDEKQEQEFFLNNELQNQNQTKIRIWCPLLGPGSGELLLVSFSAASIVSLSLEITSTSSAVTVLRNLTLSVDIIFASLKSLSTA